MTGAADRSEVVALPAAPEESSRLASLVRSPRVLGALALVYAALPALLREGGDGASRLRILAASGALLGAIPAVALARRLARPLRMATLMAGGIAGALLFVALVALGLGRAPTAADLLGWPVLFPALAFAAAVTLMLAAVGAADENRALLPVAAALGLSAFGIVPLANALAPTAVGMWFGPMSIYWMLGSASLVLLALALARWLPGRVDGVMDAITGGVMRIPARWFVWGAALLALIAAAALTILLFARQPHNADEVAQLWHARILLSGRLSLPVDPNPEFFGMDNVIDRGRWYSQFPIGGPAFLALGLVLRVAWLVNPVLLALTFPNVYEFARRAYDEGTARAAVLVLLFAPFALFMSASYMNHVPTMWLASVALAQLAVWYDAEDRRALRRSGVLIGLALGTAAAVRPLDAAIVAAVIGAMQLWCARTSGERVRSLVLQGIAGAVPVALLLLANWRTTGAPLRFGYEVLYGHAHQLGFHTDPYGTAHTPIRALMFASKYLLELDVALLESPLPAIGVIVAGLLLLRRPSRWDRLLIAFAAAQLVGYALYWHEGEFRGPRFLFTALPVFVLLVARAPFIVAAATQGTVRRAALLVLPIGLLAGWIAWDVDASPLGRYRLYRSASPMARLDPAKIERDAHLRNAVVFVAESWEALALRRMWALHVERGDAMRLLASAHPCAVRQAIVDEERPGTSTEGRLARMERTVRAYDPSSDPSPACISDLTSDADGPATYGPFFPSNTIEPDGRIGGNVVYVLDLGTHNDVLRSRFGDRTWYRFGPHLRRGDSTATLTPYPH
ncbi:MAG TPA: hypothetical protein VFI52_10075 [Gemmatimonadaceae bacterium]|nr:hypothetical protein [Gemmatimonadaceae bacterium]